MYVFQFSDGTWRIDMMTNSREERPYDGEARKLFDGVYQIEKDAYAALDRIRALRAA